MAEVGTFTVRPLPKTAKKDLSNVFKVFISSAAMQVKGIKVNQTCALANSSGQTKLVIVWPASEKIQDTIIQTSKALQDVYGLKLGDKLTLLRYGTRVPDIDSLSLKEVQFSDITDDLDDMTQEDCSHWAWLLTPALEDTELLVVGLLVENVSAWHQKRSFQIVKINGSTHVSPYRFQTKSKVKVESEQSKVDTVPAPQQRLSLPLDAVPGLSIQLQKLAVEIANFDEDPHNDRLRTPSWFQERENGIILHGPGGTGKSLLLKSVSECGWAKVFHLDDELQDLARSSERVAIIRRVFAEAATHEPSLIVVDDLHVLMGEEDDGGSKAGMVSRALAREMEHSRGGRTLVIAATRLLDKIDQNLRSLHGFSLEIEVNAPTSVARFAILKSVTGVEHGNEVDLLDRVANRTHGFVGADLHRLLQIAGKKAKTRALRLIKDSGAELLASFELSSDDFEAALREVKPTAMREIFVETPQVRWHDIGGQEAIKKTLEKALVWPGMYADDMKRFGVEPRKGLLLYGPPGCSKTMMARAAATESGHNFLAVKGAELLNMYVGESERAIRDLFQKARTVSPSIIFFDEIDAVGVSRDDGAHSGLNVVTTLLNELDGIVELKGVFVLAATNRPQAIDPALTRAGRLDTLLYVGPPDLAARRDIFTTRLKEVDAEDDVEASLLAESTSGLSGAELVSLCRRAGEYALEEQVTSGQKLRVGVRHFTSARAELESVITSEMLESYREFAERRKV